MPTAKIPTNSQLQAVGVGAGMAKIAWILSKNPGESHHLSTLIPTHSPTFAGMLALCMSGKTGFANLLVKCKLGQLHMVNWPGSKLHLICPVYPWQTHVTRANHSK